MDIMNGLHDLESSYSLHTHELYEKKQAGLITAEEYNAEFQRLSSLFDKDYRDEVSRILTKQELYS